MKQLWCCLSVTVYMWPSGPCLQNDLSSKITMCLVLSRDVHLPPTFWSSYTAPQPWIEASVWMTMFAAYFKLVEFNWSRERLNFSFWGFEFGEDDWNSCCYGRWLPLWYVFFCLLDEFRHNCLFLEWREIASNTVVSVPTPLTLEPGFCESTTLTLQICL